jgi:two-component system, NarL family, nitrate/nitrite response regulator NarL
MTTSVADNSDASARSDVEASSQGRFSRGSASRTKTTIRVLLISPPGFHRDAVKAILDREADIEIVACTSTVNDLQGQSNKHPCDVVLCDASLCEVQAMLGDTASMVSGLRLVVIVAQATEKAVLDCAQSGALACLRTDSDLPSVITALREAARGEPNYSSEMTAVLLKRLSAQGGSVAPALPGVALTVREQEVVGLVARGLSNKEIAARLSIEVATVKNHVYNVYRKLNIRRRSQLSARLFDLRRRDAERAI